MNFHFTSHVLWVVLLQAAIRTPTNQSTTLTRNAASCDFYRFMWGRRFGVDIWRRIIKNSSVGIITDVNKLWTRQEATPGNNFAIVRNTYAFFTFVTNFRPHYKKLNVSNVERKKKVLWQRKCELSRRELIERLCRRVSDSVREY